MEILIEKWQSLIGACIGAVSPFLLWWIVERYQQRKKYFEDLYFLEKVLVGQINDTLELKKDILDFINKQLNELIINVKERDSLVFSIDYTFSPLFSVVSLGDQIYNINTKSGYIENKLAKVFQLSKNMPYIIKDVKRQFESLIELNRKLVLKKINPPDVQKKDYLNNLINYKELLEHDILNTNIPTYLKALIQTREALNELRKIGFIGWEFRFNGSFHFYFNKKKYNEFKEKTYDTIEAYFKDKAEQQINRLGF